jgi:hypothetical protein
MSSPPTLLLLSARETASTDIRCSFTCSPTALLRAIPERPSQNPACARKAEKSPSWLAMESSSLAQKTLIIEVEGIENMAITFSTTSSSTPVNRTSTTLNISLVQPEIEDTMETAPVTKSRVRKAVREDIPQIFKLGKLLFEENAIVGWSEQRIVDAVDRAIRGDGAVIGVIGDVGRLEGMIYIMVAKFWYTDDAHLEEVYNYVHPDYRKSNNAKDLIDFAKTCATGIGVPLTIGIISNHKTEQKIRLYQRRLGKPTGAYWLFNAKTGK